ncbi:MAG: YihY family inner membrane protein [Spirochaetes bacterium]|nr:YihY family inner membrane protein [Spirochaetota bacterium]
MDKNRTENITEEKENKDGKNSTGIWHKYFRKIKKTVDNEYELTEKRYNYATTKLKHLLRIFTVSGKKFFEDDCPTKSSAIAYTTLISLIPTLTVGLTAFSILNKASEQKTEIFEIIQKFLAEYNLQRLYNQQMFEVISSLIDNAGKIGVIGFVVLIFSATAILRSLENSLNNIWKIKKQRPIYLKFIIYWATLTLGPILLIAGTALTNKVSEAINKPNYYVFNTENTDNIYITGSKSSILSCKKTDVSGDSIVLNEILNPVTEDEIDFNNQLIYDFSSELKVFMPVDEPVEKLKFKTNRYTDVKFVNSSGWITAGKGILLKTDNSGKSWKIIRLGKFDLKSIEMIDENTGFIAASSGELFKTSDGGITWNLIQSWSDKTRLTDMQIIGSSIFITGENGYFIKSENLAESWKITQLDESRQKKSNSNINTIHMYDENFGLAAGNDGLILITSNSGRTWSQLSYKNYNYYSISTGDRNKIYVGGEKGTIIRLNQKTGTWEYFNMKTQTINALVSFNRKQWLLGDSGMIMYHTDSSDLWLGTKGTSFIMYVLNFMAPFMVIGFCFLLMYFALPNIKVPLSAAALGASVTGSVWVAFTMLFNYYIKILADTTFAIYGALAAVPIFLLTVYASAMIILFGAEITYTLMYPDTYRKSNKSKKTTGDIRIINGIRILFAIYKNFESGKGSTGFTEITKICNDKITEADYFLDIFRISNFISQSENNTYIPSTSSRNVKIKDVIDSIHDPNLDLYSTTSDIVRKKLSEKFRLMNESRAEILGDETLDDLINAK